MSFNTAQAALIAHYRAGAFFTDPRTAYPNAAFTKPGPTVAWAALSVIPSASAPLSISHSDEQAGVFQIDLNYPLNSGAGAAQAMADSIRSWFKRGTVISGVDLGAVSYAVLGPTDGWYRLVVSVVYREFVAL